MNNKRNTNNNREEKKSEERGVRNGGAQKPSVVALDRLRNGKQNEWVRGSYMHIDALRCMYGTYTNEHVSKTPLRSI